MPALQLFRAAVFLSNKLTNLVVLRLALSNEVLGAGQKVGDGRTSKPKGGSTCSQKNSI